MRHNPVHASAAGLKMNTHPIQRPPRVAANVRVSRGGPSSLCRSMASVAALAFCSAAAPSHVSCLGATGALGTSHWAAAFPTNSRATAFPTGSTSSLRPKEYVNVKHGGRSRRRPPLSLTRAGPWSSPPPLPASALRDTAAAARGRHREEQPQQQQPLPSSRLLAAARTLLRRVCEARAPPPRTPRPATAAAAWAGAERPPAQLKHAGLVLVPWLWRPFQQPVVAKSAGGAAAGPILEVGGRTVSASTRVTQPALSFVQLQVRREAILSALILVAAPLLLRWWAKREAEHHDTLECRNVVQTYLIASSGWACAVLAAVAGKPISAVVLQAAWRAAAARSLWTWSDLGRGLIKTPGWLHASVAWWRGAATLLAGAGAVARILVLLIAMTGTWTATTAAGVLCAPTLDFLPAGLVRWASTPDDNFGLSGAQLVLGVGMYAWIAYYACFFLPYRVLYEEYQSYERRTAQVVRDMGNGPEQNVMLSTKLGPQLPRQLLRRMAKMPPGDDRDVLEAAGIVRQKAGSHTVVKAAENVKNKDGKVGVKMLALKFGDLRYWGSDLFQRFEQQLRRDKKTGRKPPDAPGSGPNRENRMTYSKIRREVKVELGKTDAEMDSDPSLSMSNLMTFDPDAEDGDPPELIKQERPGSIDAGGENLRMKSDHEKVVTTDSTPADMARAAGVPLDAAAAAAPAAPEVVRSTDKVSYKIGDSAGKALEDSIRSMSSSSPPGRGAADKMTPATATPGFAVSEKQQREVSTGKQADVVAVGVDSPPKGSKSGSGTGSGSDKGSGEGGGEEQVSRRTGAISDKCDDIASLAMEFSMRSGGSSAKKNATDTSAPPPPSPRGPPPPTARDLSTVSHMQSFVLAHELFLEYSVIVSDCFPTLT